MMRTTKWTAAQLRELCPVDVCERRYYRSVNFIDLYEDPNHVKKRPVSRKRLEQMDLERTGVGYFREGRLIRLDDRDPLLPVETYLLWENGLVREAHSFMTGYRYNERSPLRRLDPPQRWDSFWYTYDEAGRMLQSLWLNYADVTYGLHDEREARLAYTYDEKGLLLVRKTVTGPAFDAPMCAVMYDREKKGS